MSSLVSASKEEGKMGETGKQINAATTRNRTRELSIIDQMSVLTNQVHLKIQFRHRFDQKCPFTDALHRLGSRFARTSPVPLEINFVHVQEKFRIIIFILFLGHHISFLEISAKEKGEI